MGGVSRDCPGVFAKATRRRWELKPQQKQVPFLKGTVRRLTAEAWKAATPQLALVQTSAGRGRWTDAVRNSSRRICNTKKDRPGGLSHLSEQCCTAWSAVLAQAC